MARREAADETTSSERLTALVEESDALARIVAKNPSAPVSLLRALSRSEDEATRKGVRWSQLFGQFGDLVKVYSVVWSCRQNPVYHVLLLLSLWGCG